MDHYMGENVTSTEFNDHTLVYISGYVEHKVMRKLDCQSCNLLLKKETEYFHVTSPIIKIKDRGGLHSPSIPVVKIVSECDRYFNYYRSKNNIFKEKVILLRLVNSVEQIILEKYPNIFEEFDQHVECFLEGSHRIKLIRKICELFLSLRCKHLAKEEKENIGVKKVRQIMTKLILFNWN